MKLKYLFSISLVFSLLAFNAFGEDAAKLKEHKSMVSQNIDKRIATLNELKTCINAATKKEDVKACRKSHQDKMKELKAEMKNSRQAKKDK